jgi:DNA-binding beta-propeller fold protein YncE
MGGADPIVRSVTLAEAPSAVGVDADTGRAFVATDAPVNGPISGHVLMFDTQTGALLHTATVGYQPSSVVVDGKTGHVFVTGSDLSVNMIDARRGGVLRTVYVDAEPAGGALDPRSKRLFVPEINHIVIIVDTVQGRIVGTMTIAAAPYSLGVDARRGHLIASHYSPNPADRNNGNGVSVYDAGTGKLLHVITAAAYPFPATLAVDEATGRAFVTNFKGSGVSTIDTRSGALLHTTPLTGQAGPLVVDEQAGHVFVATSLNNHGSVVMLDAANGRLLRTIAVGDNPWAMAVDTRRGRVFVADPGSISGDGQVIGGGSITVLDARSGSVLRSIPVSAAMLAVDERTGHVIAGSFGVPNAPAPDPWGWLPPALRDHLPFLPPRSRSIASTVTILDPSR